jgi:hypothetical protein
VCRDGRYPALCNHALLNPEEARQVAAAEARAASEAPTASTRLPVGGAYPATYFIEASEDDETFVINGETYRATTWCFGCQEGDEVQFLSGSPFGACASATILNLSSGETCDLWCE